MRIQDAEVVVLEVDTEEFVASRCRKCAKIVKQYGVANPSLNLIIADVEHEFHKCELHGTSR